MTRDAEHTPSPQSVVVPVDPTEDMLMAARGLIMSMSFNVPNYGTTLGQVADSGFYGEHWAHILTEEERAIKSPLSKGHRAQLIYRAMLASAPAPSSLAGGEVTRQTIIDAVKIAMNDAWCDITSDTDCWPADLKRVSQRGPMRLEYRPAIWTDTTAEIAANAILAALSPEAPARNEPVYHAVSLETRGPAEDARRYREHEERFGIRPALTPPRHEAPEADAWRVGDAKHARYFEGEDAEARARATDDAMDGAEVRPVWFGVVK